MKVKGLQHDYAPRRGGGGEEGREVLSPFPSFSVSMSLSGEYMYPQANKKKVNGPEFEF